MLAIPRDVLRVRDAPRYVPTVAEIAAKCAEIRRHWTPAETRRRWARPLPTDWFPPLTHVATRLRHG
jgi:hypothetical protein